MGERFPDFSLNACVSLSTGKEYRLVDSSELKGKWAVIFFWPLDFTFVCPTEIAGFDRIVPELRALGAELYGVSGDSHYVHRAWREASDMIRDIHFPMLADYRKDLAEALGVLHPQEKVALRATYIVDPEGVIRWVSVNDLNVGRNTAEVVRVLRALQLDELCPCDWKPGMPTLTRAESPEEHVPWETKEHAVPQRA